MDRNNELSTDSPNTSRAKQFVVDVMGIDNNKTEKYEHFSQTMNHQYNTVRDQHRHRWQQNSREYDVHTDDNQKSFGTDNFVQNLMSHVGNKISNNSKNDMDVVDCDAFISNHSKKYIQPKGRIDSNGNFNEARIKPKLSFSDLSVQRMISDNIIQARLSIEKDSVLYRKKLLNMHQNITNKFNTNYSNIVGTNLNHQASSDLNNVDDYIRRLSTSRRCLICSSIYTLRDSIGKYGCYGYNISHTDNPHDALVVTSCRRDIMDNKLLNPFSGQNGAEAAFLLMPAIFIAKYTNESSVSRIKILHVSDHTIIARYNSFDDLYKNPVIIYEPGTKLISETINPITGKETPTCYVPDNQIWIVNVVDLYFKSFANQLDPISFLNEYKQNNGGNNNNNSNNNDDYMSIDEEDDNQPDIQQRWNGESAKNKNKRIEQEMFAVKFGRTERILFNNINNDSNRRRGNTDIIDVILDDLSKNPKTKEDSDPIFIPFVIIPKLSNLTKYWPSVYCYRSTYDINSTSPPPLSSLQQIN